MIKEKFNVVLTGGGTGGHIYPAIAIAGGIKSAMAQSEISFIGTEKGLEKEIVPRNGYPISFISAAGMERKLSYKSFLAIKDAFFGVGQAVDLLKKIKPQVVIGTGGYVSGPVVLAAILLRIPTAIHEQNAYAGVTNKLLNPFVSKVFLTFPEAAKHFRRKNNLVITGLPIRKEIITAKRDEALKALNIPAGKFVLTVVGGSRGARSINTAMTAVHHYMQNRKDVYVIHVTGELDYEDTLQRLKSKEINTKGCTDIQPYMHNIKHALAAADLVVGRAGASFLSEILVLGIPSILIPYPYAAENHQHWNSMSLVNGWAARLLDDKNLRGDVLLQAILEIMQDKQGRQKMHEAALKLAKPDSLQTIVGEIIKLCIR